MRRGCRARRGHQARAEGERPIPRAVAGLARAGLAAAVEGDLLAGELGFVILHRCGASFYLLLISSRRNENELWETVWAKPGEDSAAFAPWPLASSHHPTVCVWEPRAVCHEQGAWRAAICARSATQRPAGSTSRTPTPGLRERVRTDPVSVSVGELRRLAPALPEATEEDHHGKPSFRVGGKIFATLWDGSTVNVMLDEDGIGTAVRDLPGACAERWWGKRLSAVAVDLGAIAATVLEELLVDAWEHKAPARLRRS